MPMALVADKPTGPLAEYCGRSQLGFECRVRRVALVSAVLAVVLCAGFAVALPAVRVLGHQPSSPALVRRLSPESGKTSAVRKLAYSFRPDGAAPTRVTAVKPLFDFGAEDIDVIYDSSDVSRMGTWSNVAETADHFAAQAGLSGGYGFFSAAVSASTHSMTASRTQKFHAEKVVGEQKYSVIRKSPFPAKFLTSDAKLFLTSKTPAEITQAYGVFYADKLILGGALQTTVVQSRSRRDTKEDFAAHVKANYEAYAMSGSLGKVSTGSSSTGDMFVKTVVQGGDANVWLEVGNANYEAVKKTWAQTVDDSNLAIVGHSLRPLWELVSYLDSAKGEALKKFQEGIFLDDLRKALTLEQGYVGAYHFLVDLMVQAAGHNCPNGWTGIDGRLGSNGDLNQDAESENAKQNEKQNEKQKAKHLYLCGKWATSGQSITNIALTASNSVKAQNCDFGEPHWSYVPFGDAANGNLNQGAGGKHVFMCVERNPDKNKYWPVTNVAPVRRSFCPRDWYWISKRLESDGSTNQGASGPYIGMCVTWGH